jgi:hypothetical protein
LELRVPPVGELQGAEPPVPPFGGAAFGGVGQLDDDVFGREFDVGILDVAAAVGEVASVSCDCTALGLVAAERLQAGRQCLGVELLHRGPDVGPPPT